jgi:hypothetical protein
MRSGMKIVPSEDILAELHRKAAEYQSQAMQEPEPEATRAREQAKLCGYWTAPLKSGMRIP